jgi:hypothetical protein
MRKKIPPKTTKALSLPGEDHGQQLAIIRKVLGSLAPGVARKHPEFVQLIRFYLLDQQSHQPTPYLRQTLCKEMRKLQAQGQEIDVESLMLAIDGMDLTLKESKLESLEELDRYAQASKDAFRAIVHKWPVEEIPGDTSCPPKGRRGNQKYRFSRED